MNKKLVIIATLAAAIPLILYATVDIGGSPEGGAGNYIDNVDWIDTGTLSATEIESGILNLGYPYANTVDAAGAAIGVNNTISGAASNTVVVGSNLHADLTPDSLVVGEFNEDKSGVKFSVGDGTGAAARSNSFEIWEDGTVVIKKPQGDVPMGVYTTPAP